MTWFIAWLSEHILSDEVTEGNREPSGDCEGTVCKGVCEGLLWFMHYHHLPSIRPKDRQNHMQAEEAWGITLKQWP